MKTLSAIKTDPTIVTFYGLEVRFFYKIYLAILFKESQGEVG
jgi:hypothetical protein